MFPQALARGAVPAAGLALEHLAAAMPAAAAALVASLAPTLRPPLLLAVPGAESRASVLQRLPDGDRATCLAAMGKLDKASTDKTLAALGSAMYAVDVENFQVWI